MSGEKWKILTVVFAVLWLFVGATSTVDAYLTVKYAESMKEENPIGEALIQLGPHVGDLATDAAPPPKHKPKKQDVSLLVGAKMFGTILALGILLLLFQKWPVGAQIVVSGLSVFQLLLMFYIFQ
jgi:hypothetical protein